MMIKISEKEKDDLLKHKIDEYEYGNKNGNDKDLLIVIKPNIEMDSSFNNNHLFFFKDNSIDYIFCTPTNILKSILNGSNDLIYHMMFKGCFNDSCMSFLNEIGVQSFYSKKMLRSLYGVLKRDRKQLSKIKDEYKFLKKQKFINLYEKYCLEILKCNETENLDQKIKEFNLQIDKNVLILINDKLNEYFSSSEFLNLNWIQKYYLDEWYNTY